MSLAFISFGFFFETGGDHCLQKISRDGRLFRSTFGRGFLFAGILVLGSSQLLIFL